MSKSSESLREERFRVDLGGIVELLSRNLYSGKDVYVRELLQNGMDAVTAAESATGSSVRGRIRFVVLKTSLRISYTIEGNTVFIR